MFTSNEINDYINIYSFKSPCYGNIKHFRNFIKLFYEVLDFDDMLYGKILEDCYCNFNRGERDIKKNIEKIKILIEYDAKKRNINLVLSDFIILLIKKNSKHSRLHKYEFLKEICETYSTINETSVKNTFLQYYKNQVSLSDNNLNNIIIKEKFFFLNGKDCFGNTPLMYACLGGFEKIVKYLIAKGANINAKNNNGDTPLMFLCRRNFIHKETLKYLIIKGANVNAKNNNGDTPLIYLCKKDYVDEEILDYLIKEGADINARNKRDITPIILCCYKRKYNLVKYLIELGANVNEIDKDGDTVLMNCLQYHNGERERDIIKYLIEKGADIYARNNNGKTPLMIADFKYENRYIFSYTMDTDRDIHNEIMNYLRGYNI